MPSSSGGQPHVVAGGPAGTEGEVTPRVEAVVRPYEGQLGAHVGDRRVDGRAGEVADVGVELLALRLGEAGGDLRLRNRCHQGDLRGRHLVGGVLHKAAPQIGLAPLQPPGRDRVGRSRLIGGGGAAGRLAVLVRLTDLVLVLELRPGRGVDVDTGGPELRGERLRLVTVGRELLLDHRGDVEDLQRQTRPAAPARR